ncbi:putative MFS-type transporter YhjX [Amphibalanus amphitrite]|uniref:Putative MFS-type transporter YhjX n=1 Tax=Amphibalanus amphitrite TaxID=1232801 RepID=A0A6A4WWN5_AMPAM|nr:putative MFS-type transporter YhjX [Amphibalanus amphitrite]
MDNMVTRWLEKLRENPPPWQGVVVCVCGFVLELTLGAIFTFGNLTTYMTSYMRDRLDPTINYAQLMWVSASLSFFEGLTLSLGSWLTNRIGARWTAFIGCSLVTSGVSLCYFAVQHSVWLVALLFGVINGLGVGIAYVVPLVCGMSVRSIFVSSVACRHGLCWSRPLHVGTVYARVVGVVCYVLVSYFKDQQLLSQVPYVFLLTGGVYVVLQALAIAGMIKKPVPLKESDDCQELGVELQATADGMKPEDPSSDPGAADQEPEEGSAADYSSSMTIMQAVKTPTFWQLFVTYLCNNLCIGFINPLWKTFGQQFIQDDRFLSAVGSAASVFNLLGRVIWGFVNDRTNYRVAMLGVAGLLLTMFATLYLTIHGGKAMFLIWVCLVYMSFPGTFSIMPAEVAHVFGLQHAGEIYGLIWLSGGLVAPIPVFLTDLLLQRFGYLALFLTSAVFPTLSVICTLTFRGESTRRQRLQPKAIKNGNSI